jgi:small subunit ribosomal protein S17
MPRRILEGIVTSDRASKTRRVEIPRIVRHRQYSKTISRKTVCHVHDENNESAVGDRVQIEESRPLSKLKRWTLVKVLEKSKEVDVAALRASRGQKDEAGDATMGELAKTSEQPVE